MSKGPYLLSDSEGVVEERWPDNTDGPGREALTIAWEQDLRVMYEWKSENFLHMKAARELTIRGRFILAEIYREQD